MLTHIAGDLFEVGLSALGHGCNCRGSMAGGIAAQFRHRYPVMHGEYQRRCRAGLFVLGDAWAWTAPDGMVVYGLATQDRPGRHADLAAVRSSVTAMLVDAERRGLVAVGVPRLGAGIGGLSWPVVERTLDEVVADSPVRLVVVTRAG